jgi:hypothetical protein
MAFVVKDRIKETTTTTGTGTYTLAGAAIGGYNTFAEIGTGNTTYYACTDGTDWEVGLGTYTASGTTLSRDQIIESSNSNSAVNWGSGTKDIFVTLPSSKALVMDDNDEFNVNGGDAIRFGADQASSFSRMSLSINGSVGALGMSEPSSGNSTLNLTAQNLKGIGDGGDLHFLGATTGAGSSISLYGGNTKVFETSKNGSGASITGNLSVSGDLTINGTTTTVNSTTVTIDDPIFTLGGDTAPASDDNKDRGIEFRWHNGTAAKVGFFGFDDSTGKFTFIPDATNTSEVFSGTAGTIVADVEGDLTGNADTASAADFLTGLSDPDADRLLMWDDSAGAHKFVTLGSNLAFSGTTLNATDTNTDTTYSAGTGLSLTGTTFANTAPDQTVTLTGAGATSISGTYPNFTITSTDTDTNTTYTAGTGLSLSGTEFAINTTIVPRLGSSNRYEFNQEIEVPSTFAGYKQWSFVNTSGSDLAYLGYHGTNDTMELRNDTSKIVVSADSGVDLKIDDGSIAYTGVRVLKLGSNVAGALDWNGAVKVQTNAVGASVSGNLSVTGTVDGRDVSADGSKLDGIESGAEVNDPAFKTVSVSGQSDVVADADADTLTLAAGSNVTITTDASTDTVTIASTDTNTTYSAGSGLSLSGTTFSHSDTSSQASSNNSGRTYIQDITLDTYGHVTGIATATETVVNTDTNTTSLPIENSAGTTQFTATDTTGLQFVGSGATSVAFDSTNKRVTISSTDTDTNTTYSAGSGLSLSGTTFSNSAPDQTVTLTGSGATSISGTYPNFTISSTDTDTNTTYSAGTGVTLSGTTFSIGQAVGTGNSPTFSNAYIAGSLYHSGDTDTRLLFDTDTITLQTGGSSEITVNTTGVRLGDTGNGYFQPVTGEYGSIQIDGGAHGGWEGYSIGGRVVFMHDNGSAMGLYDDVYNHWKFYAILNGASYLGYGSVYNKLETTSSGITVNGDVNSTSDIRYKKNIETIDNALEKVQLLRGVTFDWDHEDFDTTNRATGVIAQDVEKVLPEAVRENEDGFKNVTYGNMVGLLIEAIKEQQEQIDALKKQLNS